MTRYAQHTDVSSERSRAEIERTLQRYGADRFAYSSSRTEAMVGFECHGLLVRFRLAMPNPTDRQFTHTEAKHLRRSEKQAYEAWEQACRQRWRALNLVVKAKLEAVEAGITTFEQEFLAHIVLPNGDTVADQVMPRIRQAYASGSTPPLLTFEG